MPIVVAAPHRQVVQARALLLATEGVANEEIIAKVRRGRAALTHQTKSATDH